MNSREVFLQRVREAVKAGNRPGVVAALEERGTLGYQGAGPDEVTRFRDEFTAAGGQPHLVPDAAAARSLVLELIQNQSARNVLVGRGKVLDRLGLAESLRGTGIETVPVDALHGGTSRESFFNAAVGISGVDYLVAETGSLAILAKADDPRSLSLLPPVHIAVAERAQIVPDLFDLFSALPTDAMPSCLSLITGPSKTGDIELKLVTGVHGPGEIHVVLVTG